MSNFRLGLAALALAVSAGAVSAQTTTPATNDPASPATTANTQQAEKPPLPGANSFTESQARDRIAEAGYKDVKSLKKDDKGIWRGVAKKGDSQVNVALDYRGNIVQE
jgi:hypothetical protein